MELHDTAFCRSARILIFTYDYSHPDLRLATKEELLEYLSLPLGENVPSMNTSRDMIFFLRQSLHEGDEEWIKAEGCAISTLDGEIRTDGRPTQLVALTRIDGQDFEVNIEYENLPIEIDLGKGTVTVNDSDYEGKGHTEDDESGEEWKKP